MPRKRAQSKGIIRGQGLEVILHALSGLVGGWCAGLASASGKADYF